MVIWLYMAAVGAYVVYGWYSYTGLYRLAAEWQLEHYGVYSVKLTLMVPLSPCLFRAPCSPSFSRTGPAAQRRLGCRIARDIRRAGCRGLAVAVGAGWYGLLEVDRKGGRREPRSLQGRHPANRRTWSSPASRATEYIVEFETKTAGMTTLTIRSIDLSATWRQASRSSSIS